MDASYRCRHTSLRVGSYRQGLRWRARSSATLMVVALLAAAAACWLAQPDRLGALWDYVTADAYTLTVSQTASSVPAAQHVELLQQTSASKRIVDVPKDPDVFAGTAYTTAAYRCQPRAAMPVLDRLDTEGPRGASYPGLCRLADEEIYGWPAGAPGYALFALVLGPLAVVFLAMAAVIAATG